MRILHPGTGEMVPRWMLRKFNRNWKTRVLKWGKTPPCYNQCHVLNPTCGVRDEGEQNSKNLKFSKKNSETTIFET
jgi:hypothetical protein